MARIKLEEILEYLYEDIQPSIYQAVKKNIPDCDIESRVIYRDFLKEIGRRRHDWVSVPDNLIDSY